MVHNTEMHGTRAEVLETLFFKVSKVCSLGTLKSRKMGMYRPYFLFLLCKGAIREGAKGAEAPPLTKSKLRKKDKILGSFDLFCVIVI